MKNELIKNQIKKELKRIFKSMDFVSDNFLNKEGVSKDKLEIYFNIYQQLGMAWEFLGLECKHWDGYKKTGEKNDACKICGKIKGVKDTYYLLPEKGLKKIGKKLKPNSKKTFKRKKEAQIIDDTMDFHGALLNVNVHNSYKSKLFGDKHDINMAAERIVTLKESGIECHIDEHLIYIKMDTKGKKVGKKKYGGFPWEIKRKDLKNFPIIFGFDEKHQFMGLTILK